MPNWCKNILTVTGEAAVVCDFIERNEGRHPYYADDDDTAERQTQLLTFSAAMPPPEEVLRAGFSKAGYAWQSEQWGTKWEPEGVIRQSINNGVQYTFYTAWSPPTSWLTNVSKLYRPLTFQLQYIEPGVGLIGTLRVQDGNSEHHGPAQDTP